MDARAESLSTTLGRRGPRVAGARPVEPDLERRPEAVLSVLEADQLFAAKQARFPRAQLSAGTRALLWGLRAYVVAMMLMVAMQVMQTLHGGH